MKYYIITHSLAEKLGCVGQRLGNENDGYLVNSADLNVQTVADNAPEVKEITLDEAKSFARKHILI